MTNNADDILDGTGSVGVQLISRPDAPPSIQSIAWKSNLEWASPRIMFAFTALSMVIHAVILLVDPRATLASNILIGVAFLATALACIQQSQSGPAETAKLWALLAAGFLLSIIGQVQSTVDALTTAHHKTAFTADFFFLVYGIPVLLAISWPNDDAGLKSFFWFDTAQALIAALLLYLLIFSNVEPFGRPNPISAAALMNLYNVENFTLAAVTSLRLLAKPARSKKLFYDNLALYLWAYAAVALVLGYVELKLDWPEGLQDVAWALPCLIFLGALAFLPDNSRIDQVGSSDRHRSAALLIDNLSPILFTILIVIMGLRITPDHRIIGYASITLTVVLYGLRSAFLQGKYTQSQRELSKSSLALLKAVDRLREQSIRDGLTGVHNRRHFDEKLLVEWQRSLRAHLCLSLLLIDIDNFKNLNDRYGHQEGDECLKKIAQKLAEHPRRPGDLIARYGGEEFSVVLPCTDQNGAMEIAEAMRAAVAGMKLPVVNAAVTISIGVCAQVANSNGSIEEFLSMADAALYRAKRQGRNRVELA